MDKLDVWQLDAADQTVEGTIRDDELTGSGKPELIRGYAGDDVLIGAPDDDISAADDTYVGGPGADIYFFDNLRRDLGKDTIQDLEKADTIRVTKLLGDGAEQVKIGTNGIIDLNPDKPGTSTLDVGDGGVLRLVDLPRFILTTYWWRSQQVELYQRHWTLTGEERGCWATAQPTDFRPRRLGRGPTFPARRSR